MNTLQICHTVGPSTVRRWRRFDGLGNRGDSRWRIGVDLGQNHRQYLAEDKKWELGESDITVKQGKGSICHAVMGARLEASAERVFRLFQRPDYDSMFTIFKVVKNHRVVSDNGQGKQEFEVEFDAQWRFWKVSGYCAIPLRMHLDMANGEIKFFQTKPGFLKVYKGVWRIYELTDDGTPVNIAQKPWYSPLSDAHPTPDSSIDDDGKSLVCLELDVRPAFIPPPPLNRALKGNTAIQVKSLFEDLKKELEDGTEIVLRGQNLTGSNNSLVTSLNGDKPSHPEPEKQRINGLDYGFKFDD